MSNYAICRLTKYSLLLKIGPQTSASSTVSCGGLVVAVVLLLVPPLLLLPVSWRLRLGFCCGDECTASQQDLISCVVNSKATVELICSRTILAKLFKTWKSPKSIVVFFQRNSEMRSAVSNLLIHKKRTSTCAGSITQQSCLNPCQRLN